MKTEETIRRKWQITGLLSGLSENKATECALFLEETAAELIKMNLALMGGSTLANVALPTARRLFEALGHKKDFMNEFKRWVAANRHKREEDIVEGFVNYFVKK